MVVLIDNYDSFTYNLVQLVGGLGVNLAVRVVRNDAATIEQIESWRPSHLIVSPGPCTPNEANFSISRNSFTVQTQTSSPSSHARSKKSRVASCFCT